MREVLKLFCLNKGLEGFLCMTLDSSKVSICIAALLINCDSSCGSIMVSGRCNAILKNTSWTLFRGLLENNYRSLVVYLC